jgi:hypothetical protein
MRYFNYGMATLLAAGMATLASAGAPAPGAVRTSGDLIAAYVAAPAAQQDQAKPKEAPAAKPPRAEKPMSQPKHQDKTLKDQKKDKSDKADMKNDRKMDKEQSKDAQKDHNHASGKNARIPDKDLKAHFGQQHKFAVKQVITTRTIVPNQTRFIYSGYTFVFVDPWPMGWGFDDDCYIDYIDGGYFLFDPVHPGMRVTLLIAG